MDNATDNAGLLPDACPFCKSPNRRPDSSRYVTDEGAFWRVQCLNTACPVRVEVVGDSELDAISKWNTRTPASPSVDAMPFKPSECGCAQGLPTCSYCQQRRTNNILGNIGCMKE